MGLWTRGGSYMVTFSDCIHNRKVEQQGMHKVNLQPIMQTSLKSHQSKDSVS